eukprot:TRINITY_DN2822_c0_g1_i3.p1 TRINITY_DN2822_c0_g1~~TRINITY_DN2822_c0_g1_i3.p1  ORF type:complete len:437 (-),score=97.02 TRINITY_DN2822_c0_g1_i3:60-1370(-)
MSTLVAMFPTIDRIVLNNLFEDMGRNVQCVADFLLSSSVHDPNPVAELPASADVEAKYLELKLGDANEKQGLPVDKLPIDVLLVVSEFLTMFDLAHLGRVSRDCYNIVQSLFQKVTYLNYPRQFQNWPDYLVLSMVSAFRRIEKLNLSKCVNFHGYRYLAGHCAPTLSSLNLSGCTEVTDEEIEHIVSGFPDLLELDLSGCGLTDLGLDHISGHLDQLKVLNLTDCPHIRAKGVSHVMSRLVNLETLVLKGCPIRREGLEFADPNNSLMHLNIQACNRIPVLEIKSKFCYLESLNASHSNLTSVTLHIPTLQSLNLSSLRMLRNLQIRAPILFQLNLSGCNSLESMSGSCPSLLNINMYNCRSLDWATFTQMMLQEPNRLTHLNVCGLPQLTDDDVFELFRASPCMVALNLEGCKAVSPNGLRFATRELQARLLRP